ncbi:MAG: M23 family metallopeptidase [Anaerolineae bacterium]
MLGQEKNPRLTIQVVFAVAMALLVAALVGSVVFDRSDGRSSALSEFLNGRLARLASAASVTEVPVDPGLGGQPVTLPATSEPSSTLDPGILSTPEPAPSATLKPMDALRRDHYWLERPIAPPGENRVARFYPYGSRMDGSYPVHFGVEMVNAAGTPVLAPASGVVVVAGSDDQQVYGARVGFYGQVVIIQLDQRFQGAPVYVVYGHLSEVQVSVGQPVTVGQQVGLVGATGYAESPHLHSEVRIGKNDYRATVNPELWYKPGPSYGTLAGALLGADGRLVDSETKLVLRSARGTSHEVFTYPLSDVNPDPEWTENFAIGDLESGAWTAEVFFKGRLYTHEFVISPGETTWLAIPTG